MAAKGSALKGALAKSPRGGQVTSLPVKPPMPVGRPNSAAGIAAGVAQGAGLQRLSPGVYRNAQGNLVGNKGQALPGQQKQPIPRPSSVVQGVAQGAAFGDQQMPAVPQNNPALGVAQQFQFAAPFGGQQQQPSWRPPAPNQMQGGIEMPQQQMYSPDKGFDSNAMSQQQMAFGNMMQQAGQPQQQGFGMANRMFQSGMSSQPIQRQMEPVQLATTEAEWQQRFNPYKG